jgi:hypothetical protein
MPEDGLGRRLEDMHVFHRDRRITHSAPPGRRTRLHSLVLQRPCHRRGVCGAIFRDAATEAELAKKARNKFVNPKSLSENALV